VDTRLIILAVTFALVVVSIIVLIVTLVRSRRPAVPAEGMVAQPGDWPMLNAAPADASNSVEDGPFVAPKSGMAAVLSQPLRTGTWRPDAPNASQSPVAPVGDYWDSLIDEPELLLREPAVQAAAEPAASGESAPSLEHVVPPITPREQAPVLDATPEPAVSAAPAPVLKATPEPTVVVAPQPVPEATPARTIEVMSEPTAPLDVAAGVDSAVTSRTDAPETEDDGWIVDLVAELDAPEPATTPLEPKLSPPSDSVPGDSAALSQPPTSEPLAPAVIEPVIIPAPVFVTGVEPVPASESVFEPPLGVVPPVMTEPIVESEPSALPVIGPVPAATRPAEEPPVTPTPPRPSVTIPVTPIPPAQEPRPQVAAVARPAEPRPPVVVHAESPPAVPGGFASDPRQSAREAAGAEFELVAPVEMWFGEARVGVKPGSKTYDRFQRIAKVLFDDLLQANSDS